VRARRIVLTLVALSVLAVVGTSLVRTVRSFYRLDFSVTWEERGILVGEVPAGSSAALSALEPGELIIAVDAIEVERLVDPAFALAAGQEHLLTVRSPSGFDREVVFEPPAPDIDPVYLARSAVGLVALFCALWVLWTTNRRETATFLLLACAALIIGGVPSRTAASHQGLLLIHRLGGAALPFLIARFFTIFPERDRSMRSWDLLTAAALGGAACTVFVPDLDAWWKVVASAVRVLFSLSLLYGIILYLRRWWAAARVARVRRQLEWSALGLFVGGAPYLALVALPSWIGIPFEPFAWMAVLPIVAVPLSFVAALTEYRLWDLEPITRDSLTATLVIVVGGFIFALTNHFLQRYAGGLGSARNLFAFATGVLLVVLLQPVRRRVERFLDQWLHHGRPTPRWLLTHSTRDLAQLADPRELLMRLAETLHEGLEFDLVATYLRRGDGSFELVRAIGDTVVGRIPFSVVDSAFPDEREQALADAGFALRVPLERVGTIHGLLYLGLRRGIFPLGAEGQEVVSAFAAQAAVALESARYLDDLRRQAEEYRILHANTQRIIESSAAAILVCDASGRILSANSQAAGIFEHDAQELVGRALKTLVHLPSGWREHLPLHAANAEATTRSDPPRRVIMAASVLELETGSFNGRVVVLQDVTEFRNLQDRMREQERLASLGRLASGLSHEINTPLTGIASFAQMLGEMTPGDDPRASLVSKLVDQSFRVSRIVANLHEAVRGSREGRIAFELGAVTARAAEDAARSLGAVDRLKLVGVIDEVFVWGATGPVELAVSNLVRNAIEASPQGSTVSVEVVADSDWAEVRVRDAGPGVPLQLADKVFEPFFTTKNDRGGTGMGLAITRDMIAQLGGEVRLESAPEGGAVATIKLQRCRESEASSS
jgi:PAS domain S-box-containing protein